MTLLRNEWMRTATKDAAVKGMSEILAARQIAQERDPQKGNRTIVVRNEHEEEDKNLLARKAYEIRRDPAFRSLMQNLSDKPAERRQQIAAFCENGGKKLNDDLNTTRTNMEKAKEEATKQKEVTT